MQYFFSSSFSLGIRQSYPCKGCKAKWEQKSGAIGHKFHSLLKCFIARKCALKINKTLNWYCEPEIHDQHMRNQKPTKENQLTLIMVSKITKQKEDKETLPSSFWMAKPYLSWLVLYLFAFSLLSLSFSSSKKKDWLDKLVALELTRTASFNHSSIELEKIEWNPLCNLSNYTLVKYSVDLPSIKCGKKVTRYLPQL